MNIDRLFSDDSKFVWLTISFVLLLLICIFSSVMGRASTQSKADRFSFCIDHPQSCRADIFDIWVRPVGCLNNKTIAILLDDKLTPSKKKIALSTECNAYGVYERVRLIAKVSDNHVFKVIKSSPETTINRLIQWSKYLISIFGLLLASIFIYRQTRHNQLI